MNKTVIIILLVAALAYAQGKAKITFEVIAPSLKSTDKIYVVGNLPEIGSWNPSLVELESHNNFIWKKTILINKGSKIEYKFTRGSWNNEALGLNATIPSNSILLVENDTLVSRKINYWRDGFNFKVEGQVTGKVIYHEKFVLDGLKPRDIFVWLPPDYEKNINKRYPVFYMHDGQNLIDPKKSNTFVDWQVDETADSLIRNGEIKPFIIVGINNTEDRSIEYSNSHLGNLYTKLIVEKIKPFIDSTYRTMPSRENCAVGGSSMGGLISMICLWNHPNVFSKAACFSPAFKYRDFDYTKVVANDKVERNNVSIYIDNGGAGLETILQPGVDEMINVLKEKGYVESKDLKIFIDAKAEHNEAAWAKRVWMPFKFFFGLSK